MLGKGHGGLYKAPTQEERRNQRSKGREISDTFTQMHLCIYTYIHNYDYVHADCDVSRNSIACSV